MLCFVSLLIKFSFCGCVCVLLLCFIFVFVFHLLFVVVFCLISADGLCDMLMILVMRFYFCCCFFLFAVVISELFLCYICCCVFWVIALYLFIVFIKVTLLTFSSGPDIPFVAVYKTQRDGESETQDRESEYSSWLQHRFAFTSLRLMLKTLAGDLVTQRRRENMENDLVRRGRSDHLCTESLFVHQPSPGIMAVITLLLTMDVLITLWPARRLYQHTVMWSLQCVCVCVCHLLPVWCPCSDSVESIQSYYCRSFHAFSCLTSLLTRWRVSCGSSESVLTFWSLKTDFLVLYFHTRSIFCDIKTLTNPQ